MVGWGASWWRRVWAGLVRPAATHAQAANSPKAAGGPAVVGAIFLAGRSSSMCCR